MFTEREPIEILNGTKAGGLQRGHKGQDRQHEREYLANYGECGCGFSPRLRQTQNDQRNREWHGRDQPEIGHDPGIHWAEGQLLISTKKSDAQLFNQDRRPQLLLLPLRPWQGTYTLMMSVEV